MKGRKLTVVKHDGYRLEIKNDSIKKIMIVSYTNGFEMFIKDRIVDFQEEFYFNQREIERDRERDNDDN